MKLTRILRKARKPELPLDALFLSETIFHVSHALRELQQLSRYDADDLGNVQTVEDRRELQEQLRKITALLQQWVRAAQAKLRREYLAPNENEIPRSRH